MTLLNEITKIENGRIFTADRAGDKTAYKGYLIGETLLGKFWIEKDEAVILHEADSIAKAKAEIDALVGVDKKLFARDSVSPSPQYIVRCLNRDLATKKQRIQYAESIAQAGGENAHVYAEAAEILKKEGGTKDETGSFYWNQGYRDALAGKKENPREVGVDDYKDGYKSGKKEMSGDTKDGGPGSGVEGHTTSRQSSSIPESVKSALSQMRVYGEKGASDAFFRMSKADRDSFDKWLISIKHPLAYEAGTQEHRFKMVAKELSSRQSKDDGPVKVSKDSSPFSPDEAKAIGETAGVDFTKICPKQFAMGLAVELEHSDLTQGDPGMTAKIVLAHLKEDGQYYTKLAKMESGTGIKDQRGAYGGIPKRDGSGMGVGNRSKDGSSLKMKLKDILRKRK